MKPEDCKPGLAVLYQPLVGPAWPSYRGIVREQPWRLGDGTWVTHLSNMDPAYAKATGGREVVHGAALFAIELEPQTVPGLPNSRCKKSRANSDGTVSLCLVQKQEHSGDCIFSASPLCTPEDRAVVLHLARLIRENADVRYYVGGRGTAMRDLLFAAIAASGFEGDPAKALTPALHRRDDLAQVEQLQRQLDELRAMNGGYRG